jgi:hypothetical protein
MDRTSDQPKVNLSFLRSNSLEFQHEDHRVDRVLSFFSSRPNWDPQPPHPQASVSPHTLVWGGTHSLAGELMGGPNSDDIVLL